MHLATVISITWPALTFVALAVLAGRLLYAWFRRPLLCSLAGSLAVIAVFLLARTALPRDFWYYAQDMIHEPLWRDIRQHPGETLLSAVFHFGVPYGLLALLVRFGPARSKDAAKPLPASERSLP